MEHWQGELRGLKEGPLSTEPIDVTPAAAELRGKVPEVELSATQPTTLPPNWNEMSGAERQAFVDDMLRKACEPAGPTAVSMHQPLAGALKTQVTTIEEPAKAYPAGTPARDVLALRAQAGKATARGGAWKKLPGRETTPAAEAPKDAQQAFSKVLHDSLPGLDVADLKYSTWRKVSEARGRQWRRSAWGMHRRSG